MSALLSWKSLRRLDDAIPSAVWSIVIPAVIAIGMSTLLQLIPRPPLTSVVRGFRPPGPPADFTLRPPRAAGDQGVTLRWHRLAGADSYQVRLYDSELDSMANLSAGPDSSFLLTRGGMVDGAAPQQVLVYRVHAFRDGLEFGLSEVGACRLP